jgi:hypothetical protein
LARVKLKEVDPFSGMLLAPNAVLMVGAAATEIEAEAVPPVPPLAEEIGPLVLLNAPADALVTFTESVQLPPAAIEPPLRVIRLVPAVAVAVPPQVVVRPLGVATTNPAGRASLNATPASLTVFAVGFVTAKLRLLVPFGAIIAGLKASAMLGGATTASDAVAVFPAPPSMDVTLTLFVSAPAAVPVTFTFTTHEAPGANVAPARLITDVPEPAPAVPVQVVVKALGVDTNRPAGKLSLNAIPVRLLVFAAGFVMVKLRSVLPFSGTLGTAKLSVIDGGNAAAGLGLGLGVGVGIGVAVGVGVGVAVGIGVGVAVGAGVGVGVALGVGVGVALGVGVGVAVGAGVGVAVGVGVGVAVGAGVGVGVALGVGVGVALGVGVGVALGVGVAAGLGVGVADGTGLGVAVGLGLGLGLGVALGTGLGLGSGGTKAFPPPQAAMLRSRQNTNIAGQNSRVHF